MYLRTFLKKQYFYNAFLYSMNEKVFYNTNLFKVFTGQREIY